MSSLLHETTDTNGIETRSLLDFGTLDLGTDCYSVNEADSH